MASLITGATGFIGMQLARRLRNDGEPARALVRNPAAALAAMGVTPMRGDLTAPDTLNAAVSGADCVYHLAAALGDWGSESTFQRINVDGTRHLLDAAVRAGCARFVYVSSFVVYGPALEQTAPCDEETPLEGRALSAYARSKRAAEALVRARDGEGGLRVTIVRPGNVFGPGSRYWVDEVVSILRAGGAPLIAGGQGRASLAYVDNVADLLVAAARAPIAAGRVYNATDGTDITWKRYFSDLAAAASARAPRLSVPGPVAVALAAAMEGAARLARKKTRPLLTREAVRLLRCRAPVPIDRARKELGFSPTVSYEDGLARVGQSLRP